MATAIMKTAEDQITCTICLEIFEEPKALPCLHTFCKKCIGNYIIEKHSQNRKRNGYQCPICRRHVSVPLNMKQNPKIWVDQLVNNHVVSTMIDAYRSPRGEQYCADHPKKELGFFCVDHSKFICSVCCYQHRHCNYVITNEKSRNNVETAKETNSTKLSRENSFNSELNLLSEQCNSLEEVLHKRRNTWEFLHQSGHQLQQEIVSMRRRITELMSQHNEGTEIDVSREVSHVPDQTNIQEETHVHTVKLPYQGKPSWITGIAILPSGKLLLVDHMNAVVTVLSLFLNCMCTTNIHPAPYDVVSVSSTHDHVLMSIPYTRELMRCEVLEDGSVLVGHKLKTSIVCRAIASDERYVAVCSNSELQIFETDGDVWMIVLDESYESTKLTYITMTSSEQKVFITDQTFPEPHIKCIDFFGAILWKVADVRIGLCTGICVTGTQLMLTSWDSGKMFTLSFNGKDLKTFNNNTVTFPWKLHASTRQNIICVSQHRNTLSEEDKRIVKAFHMI